jgi:hypothetical protein
MKQLFFSISCLLCVFSIKSQTINPVVTSEVCPATDIVFTVTVPGTNPSIASWTGSPIIVQSVYNSSFSGGNTTFNFRGRFNDVNAKQVFRVTYTNSNNVSANFEPEFKRIKSLFHGACTPIQPNQTTITSPRCQVNTHTISFNNVQWKTEFESPSLCFGTITTYEYQLPANWSLNGQTSTGSNWIQGNNNVTVTSDLASGVNGNIKIRPINSCSSGLQPGAFSTINVSRPAPSLNISPSTQTICSGSANYTISGVPSGAAVSWSVSNTAQASVSPQPGNQNVAVVTRTGSSNVNITLTATVTHCSFTYPADARVVLGTPPAEDIIGIDPGTYLSAGQYVTLSINEPATSYSWSMGGGNIIGSSTDPTLYAKLDNCFPGQEAYNEFSVTVSYQNGCGTSINKIETAYAKCDGGFTPEFNILVSPNPAISDMVVEIVNESPRLQQLSKNALVQYQLYDLNTKQPARQWTYSNDQNKRVLNVRDLKRGMYVLQITKGNYRQSVKIMVD